MKAYYYLLKIFTFALFTCTGFLTAQEPIWTILDVGELKQKAIPIANDGIYQLSQTGNPEKLSDGDYILLFDTHFVVENYTSTSYIYTNQNRVIEVPQKVIFHKLFNLESKILVQFLIPDEDYFIPTDEYALLTIEGDHVAIGEKLDLRYMKIQGTSVSDFEDARYPPSRIGFVWDKRVRDDMIFYFGDRKNFVFQLQDNAITLLGSANSPLELQIPKLENYEEGIIIDNELYLHNLGTGESTKLGKVINGEIFENTLLIYKGLDNNYYFFDPLRVVSYSITNENIVDITISPTIGFDGGYVYTEFEDINGQEAYDIKQYFVLTEGGEHRIILELHNERGIEQVFKVGTKLYITGFDVSFIYDYESKEVTGIYQTLNKRERGVYWVLYMFPFAGKTYFTTGVSTHYYIEEFK